MLGALSAEKIAYIVLGGFIASCSGYLVYVRFIKKHDIMSAGFAMKVTSLEKVEPSSEKTKEKAETTTTNGTPRNLFYKCKFPNETTPFECVIQKMPLNSKRKLFDKTDYEKEHEELKDVADLKNPNSVYKLKLLESDFSKLKWTHQLEQMEIVDSTDTEKKLMYMNLLFGYKDSKYHGFADLFMGTVESLTPAVDANSEWNLTKRDMECSFSDPKPVAAAANKSTVETKPVVKRDCFIQNYTGKFGENGTTELPTTFEEETPVSKILKASSKYLIVYKKAAEITNKDSSSKTPQNIWLSFRAYIDGKQTEKIAKFQKITPIKICKFLSLRFLLFLNT